MGWYVFGPLPPSAAGPCPPPPRAPAGRPPASASLVARASGVLLLALGVLLPRSVGAQWTEVRPGIDYRSITRSGPSQRIHVTRVDLHSPHVGLRATRERHRGQTTSSFGRQYGVRVAINGGFFRGTAYRQEGLAMADGRVWSRGADEGGGVRFVALGADNRVEYKPNGRLVPTDEIPNWYRQAINGRPVLVRRGENVAPDDCPAWGDLCRNRHPRTATGVSRNGRRFYMVVVDGRSSSAAGMTTRQLARLMVSLGAWEAINHDGGGSSTMWIRGRGVVNRPSDGRQRVVGNHLGVVWHHRFCKGRVRGRIRARGGDPGIEGAEVRLEGERTFRATTGADGHFEIDPVACGVYTVSASADGYRTRIRPRQVHVDPVAWSRGGLWLEPGSDPKDAGAAGGEDGGRNRDGSPFPAADGGVRSDDAGQAPMPADDGGGTPDRPDAATPPRGEAVQGCSAVGAADPARPISLIALALAMMGWRRGGPRCPPTGAGRTSCAAAGRCGGTPGNRRTCCRACSCTAG